MWQARYSLSAPLLLSALIPLVALITAEGQTAPHAEGKLALRAALVLTPEFCATKSKKGDFFSGKETFDIGKSACAALEPALSGAFSSVTRVDVAPSSVEAQVVLVPRFVDVGATKALGAFSNRELVVL